MHFDPLSGEQEAAVASDDAPLRILAGPGAGKTRVLTHRIARRIADGSADARRVLALTFTRRAAHELRSRLNRMGIRDLGAVGTFHSTALTQIRQYRSDHGKRPPIVLAGRRPVLAQLIEDFPQLQLKTAISEIDWLSSQNLTPDEYRNGPGVWRVGEAGAGHLADLQNSFVAYKRKRGLLDFDDILAECTTLLKTDKAFRDAQHWVFRHFFVDEFQDLNRVQFDLLKAWLGDRKDLCVVGDPDQAIYGWNGADSSLLSDFSDHFPSATTVSLTDNHRSQPRIIDAANAIIGKADSPGRKRASTGEFPTRNSFANEKEEAVGIARYLRDLRSPETRWSHHAVLARTNDQLELIASVFNDLQVPYRLRSQGGILRLPEVKDLIDELCAAESDFSALAIDLFDNFDHGVQKRVAELAVQYGKENFNASGPGFREWLRTLRPGDLDYHGDGVDLATFHAAKGLEWPNVVIAGLEQGLVPIRSDDPEERRLLYVAVSRAQQRLHLTWAKSRQVRQVSETREPSPWLDLITTSDRQPSASSRDVSVRYLAEARKKLAAHANSDVGLRDRRLRDWIHSTSRARRIEPSALLPEHLISEVARKLPASISELSEVTGLAEHRLKRVGPEILEVIADDAPVHLNEEPK
ncbi:MAG: ATP-dependent DNA helicase UvrD2 [Acidimicrobiales bacterium]|nr:ATP-dependent DNA helicase UvrD2 [Acidimicrobiales bacterium]